MPQKLDNKPINNSHRGMRFAISAKDVANGKRRQPDACAAAGALCNLQGIEAAKVYRHCVYIKRNGKWERFRTSAALRLETIIYDRDGKFMPAEFDLLPIPISQIVGKKKRERTNNIGHNSRKKSVRHRMQIPGTRPTANSLRG